MSNLEPRVVTEELSDNEISRLKTKATKFVDAYSVQTSEIEEIKVKAPENKAFSNVAEVWIEYPSSGLLVRSVDSNTYFQLRTFRNKNLITDDEQKKLSESVVGIAGMSVGVSIAMGVSRSGISSTIKIADHDVIETTNLNRLPAGIDSLGMPKVDFATNQIYLNDPFANVVRFDKGVNADNIDDFFDGGSKLDIVVDEIDDFNMKALLRYKAAEYKIPLIMMTSIGDNILIDIERYDYSEQPKPFNGATELELSDLDKPKFTMEEERRLAVQIVGQKYIPTRALESLTKMGKTIGGRPQLYSTIMTDGGLGTFIIREILLGTDIKSGRYFVEFPALVGLENVDILDSDGRRGILGVLTKNH